MGSQGFRNIAGNPFVYQEDTRSAAFGLDAAAQTWKIAVSSTTGALPTSTAQLIIDPATNGNVTIDPNGTGDLVVTSGNVSLTAGNLSLPNSSATVGRVNINSTTFLSASKYGTTSNNISIGVNAGSDWRGNSSCTGNIAIGSSALYSMQSNDKNNIAIGTEALYAHDEANDGYNTAIGYQAAKNITGSYNTVLGYSAGTSASGNSDSNIWIRNVAGSESNTLRIGTHGSGTGQQSTCYIAGIYGVTVGATNGLMQIDSAYKLGSTNSPSITGTYTTSGGNFALPSTASNGTTGVLTINGTNMIAAPATANTFLGISCGRYDLAGSPNYNTFIGNSCGRFSNVGAGANGPVNCVAIGYDAMGYGRPGGNAAATSVVAIGYQAMRNQGTYTTGSIGIGYQAGYVLGASSDYNVLIGYQAANQMTEYSSGSPVIGPVQNVVVGAFSGSAWRTNERYNIVLGASVTGALNDVNILRIGNSTGSGSAGQVDKAYVCGIYGRTPAGTLNIALVDSNNQLGSTATLSQSYITNGMVWNNVTGTTQAAAVNNEYTANNGSLVTITLPATAAVNDRVRVVGSGAGGWKVAQNSGQTIHHGSLNSTTGATGYIASSAQYDCVELVCNVANTDWVVAQSNGTITVA